MKEGICVAVFPALRSGTWGFTRGPGRVSPASGTADEAIAMGSLCC